jgi:hypothetical protein
VSGKIVRKLALYQGQLRMAAHSIPVGFISAAAGGYGPAIQKDLTKVPETSNAPEGRPQSGNHSSVQRKIQDIAIRFLPTGLHLAFAGLIGRPVFPGVGDTAPDAKFECLLRIARLRRTEIGARTHPRGSVDHKDKHILPVEATSWI